MMMTRSQQQDNTTRGVGVEEGGEGAGGGGAAAQAASREEVGKNCAPDDACDTLMISLVHALHSLTINSSTFQSSIGDRAWEAPPPPPRQPSISAISSSPSYCRRHHHRAGLRASAVQRCTTIPTQRLISWEMMKENELCPPPSASQSKEYHGTNRARSSKAQYRVVLPLRLSLATVSPSSSCAYRVCVRRNGSLFLRFMFHRRGPPPPPHPPARGPIHLFARLLLLVSSGTGTCLPAWLSAACSASSSAATLRPAYPSPNYDSH
eukprot:GHVU01080663.1.p1 GENE.GHVU01080663.1~~GHVU01080663.1.p1  ORF type:complete len:265 (-),score=26.68 GHVU01080663.1:550-1344(-)